MSAIIQSPDQPREALAQPSDTRRRTRRACDKCSSFRVRCDGGHPCRRCDEYGHPCHYARDVKKRGRKPTAEKSGKQHQNEEHPGSWNSLTPRSVTEDTPVNGNSPPEVQHVWQRQAHSLSFQAEESHNLFPRETQTSHSPSYHEHTIAPPHDAGPIDTVPSNPPKPTSRPFLPPLRRPSHSIRRISQIINPPLPPLSESVFPESPNAAFRHSVQQQLPSQLSPGIVNVPFCRYRCLDAIMPLLVGIINQEVACTLIEYYFIQPDSSLFRSASPYVLTHVIRKRALFDSDAPRPTTPALLVTMLWVSAQTADIPELLLPGARGHVCEELRKLAMTLFRKRDRDHWNRGPGGSLSMEDDGRGVEEHPSLELHAHRAHQPPEPLIDDVLTLILLSIVISGGDFKTDCLKWWSKAVRLAEAMGLNRAEIPCDGSGVACVNLLCHCRRKGPLSIGTAGPSLADQEAQEERRRTFWLLFALDRHLALSFNSPLHVADDEIQVLPPLPTEVWEQFDLGTVECVNGQNRIWGPPTLVTGFDFLEYFLPLMAILGDVIRVHHRRCHPRLGTLDDSNSVAAIENLLNNCAQSISDLEAHSENGMHAQQPLHTPSTNSVHSEDPFLKANYACQPHPSLSHLTRRPSRRSQQLTALVCSYARFIVSVLHILLHGKWDAVSMLIESSDWITSPSFTHASTHAILASNSVAHILHLDPELTFMPYLFGIYLLHGSFVLLLFADRMPQVGANESVERACETIIRAHEVCVVTLSTEFQKRFRKVLRSTLLSVRNQTSAAVHHGPHDDDDDGGHDHNLARVNSHGQQGDDAHAAENTVGNRMMGSQRNGAGVEIANLDEEVKARRRVLSLYRWTGGRGLAL